MLRNPDLGDIAVKIKLCSDSTCDLPQALLDKYSISTVPLTVTMGEKAYRDGLDICSEDIFRHVQAGNPLPKTSAGNVGEYAAYFAPWVEQGYEVIHISLSSCISSAFSNASLAAEELGHVTVIDSLNLCGAQGLLVLRCADLKGKSLIDVGCGAGFPGVPLALVRPEMRLTLLDSLQKRLTFLDELCKELRVNFSEWPTASEVSPVSYILAGSGLEVDSPTFYWKGLDDPNRTILPPDTTIPGNWQVKHW